MKKIIPFLLALGAIALIGSVYFWNLESEVLAQNRASNDPLEAVNRKAKAARSGELAKAKEYVEEVINVTGFQSELRGFTSTSIVDRIGRAESLYRLGQTEGIPEAKVVRTLNGLVKKFGLPAYARTNRYEVRKLRLSLLPILPETISRKNSGESPRHQGHEFDSTMSPAESFLVLAMLSQQKLVNKDYQMTPSERQQNWSNLRANEESRRRTLDGFSGRSSEIRASIAAGIRRTQTLDALQLSQVTLNTLGIEP